MKCRIDESLSADGADHRRKMVLDARPSHEQGLQGDELIRIYSWEAGRLLTLELHFAELLAFARFEERGPSQPMAKGT